MGSNVTLKQIAAELGVSAMTVSRALNNHENVDKKTKERIISKARSMGYTPNQVAKSLVSRKTQTIGVVIPEIAHTFFAQVVSGIDSVTYRNNYKLLLTNSAEDIHRERIALETLVSQRVDGILISCSEKVTDYDFYKKIIASGTAMVFFDRCIKGLGASTISVDDRESSKKMTQHMIGLGYEKIAYLSGPVSSIGKDRLQGFKDAMKENNLKIHENWIIESGYTEKGGYTAMNEILEKSRQKPGAVVCVNDPAAFGAIEAIEQFGLTIPNDIAICGFSDDIRAKLLKCPLTTVYQPAERIGMKAAEKLIKVIENKDEPVEDIILQTDLIIRKSCGNGL